MKSNIVKLFAACSLLFGAASCNYLDVSDELAGGITEISEVFDNVAKTRSWYGQVYDNVPDYSRMWNTAGMGNIWSFYADELCITTRYLSTVVQRMTGVTPKDIIDTRCIQEIKMLLCTTNDSIQEIAFRLNFPDQSFCARYFKRNTGMSPVEYRKSRGISVI